MSSGARLAAFAAALLATAGAVSVASPASAASAPKAPPAGTTVADHLLPASLPPVVNPPAPRAAGILDGLEPAWWPEAVLSAHSAPAVPALTPTPRRLLAGPGPITVTLDPSTGGVLAVRHTSHETREFQRGAPRTVHVDPATGRELGGGSGG